MFSNIVVKSVSSCGVYCVSCSLSQTARHTIHTTAWNTFYHNVAEHLTTYFTDYIHKIVTLARFGIGSLMMVQVDRNM